MARVINVDERPRTTRHDDVRSYVAEVVGCQRDRILTVDRFADGNRHDVYKVTSLDAAGDRRDVVVRVSLGADPDERDRAEREAMVLQMLGGLVAPQLLDVRLTSSWFTAPVLMMQLVPGHSRELATAPPRDIERLGAVVGTVHGHALDEVAERFVDPGTILSYAEGRLQHILRGLPWARPPLPRRLHEGLRQAAEVIQHSWSFHREAPSFQTDDRLALLHGDIALGNVLWGPDPVLIDWEYARLGDPADEIAYLFDQNGLDAADREAFWRGYRSCAGSDATFDDGTIDRVDWWEPLTLLGSTLWWAERFVRRTEAHDAGTDDPAVSREPGYYLDRVRTRLDRLEHLLAQPETTR